MSGTTYFVSGIGTDVGKTVVSALLVRHFKADYWKPIQCGDLDNSDAQKVAEWAALQPERLHAERYRLETPASPHYAAELAGEHIQLQDFDLPVTDRPLIVEGAGGLFVPLNDQETILDLIEHLKLPVFLVSRHYLGSINHTILSIEALRQRNIPLAGLIYNGYDNKDTVEIIRRHTGVEPWCEVEELKEITAAGLDEVALRRRQARNTW